MGLHVALLNPGSPEQIIGVARDDVNSRLTAVALAVPAPLVVGSHLQWSPSAEQLHEPRMHAVG